jgi:hypothetical protein
VKKLLMALLLIALGLLVVACGSSPTLLPTESGTVTPPASPAAVSPSLNSTASPEDLLLSDGTYEVGTAIPAGSYKGQSLSENSHYEISTDPDGKDIVARSPSPAGEFSVKLKKGQYLQVSGVMKITKTK